MRLGGSTLFAVAAAFVAVALGCANYFFGNKLEAVTWHEGPAWEEFLPLYDEWIASGYGNCTAKDIDGAFGTTRAYGCGDQSAKIAVIAQAGAAASSIIYTSWVLPRLVDGGAFVIAVDYICDVGRSHPKNKDNANCPSSESDFVVWIKEIKAAFGIAERPVTLLGYSYGGFVSASVAFNAPGEVSRLVAIAPAAVVAPITRSFILRMLFHIFVYSGKSGFAFENWLSATDGFDFARDSPKSSLDFKRAVRKVSPSATILTVQPYHFPREKLVAIASHCPTLIIIGDKEVVVDVNVARQTAQGIAGLKLSVYPNTGHLLLIEQARDRIEQDIADFVLRKDDAAV